jgi:hypothetical protein
MSLLRTLAPLAAALGLLALPAAGGAAQSVTPPAHADGGGAPAVIPSIVSTRIAHAQAALGRASRFADSSQATKAAGQLNVARAQLRSAWNATKYVIKTSPPSVAGDVFPDGGAAAGPVYAGREDTAFAFLSAEHDLVTTAVGLMTKPGAKSKVLRTSWLNAIAGSQALRKSAVAYIHKLKAPGTFPAVMPGLVPFINDEVKQLSGRLKLIKFKGLTRKSLLAARTRDIHTRKLVNRYWPPAPAG